MNIYLAGPMRGIENLNFPAFDLAAKELRDAGHTVFNPAEQDREKGYIGKPFDDIKRDCIMDDLTYIARKADTIALLPGWQESKGARTELCLAEFLDLAVLELVPLEDNKVGTLTE